MERLNRYARWLRIAGVLLVLKSSLSIIWAALDVTPLPAPVLVGLSLAWISGGVMLLWLAGRLRRLAGLRQAQADRLSPKGSRTSPPPHAAHVPPAAPAARTPIRDAG